MKRLFLTNNGLGKKPAQDSNNLTDEENGDKFLIDIPENLKDYANRLRLLNDIPLTYLLTDVSDLPPESIRFGVVDKNWIDAYIDGAFSIGRVCDTDTSLDARFRGKFNREHKLTFSKTPRMQMMHPNHKALLPQKKPNNSENNGSEEKIEFISVVLIRSELIKNQKELHFSAYVSDNYDFDKKKPKDNAAPLDILRIEKISNDIMICLFSGILEVFIIDEPKTGLKFGGSKDTNSIDIDIRSVEETDIDFGKKYGSLAIQINNSEKESNPPTNNNPTIIETTGKVNVEELAKQIQIQINNYQNDERKKDPTKKLKDITITPSIFAFEMLSVPHKAVFSSLSLETKKNN